MRMFSDADGMPPAEPPRKPKVVIVSSAEIGRLGTLDADYYVNREDGESPDHYRRRTQAADAIRRAEEHERRAAALRADAAALLAGDDQ
jgi:hypothetical protein